MTETRTVATAHGEVEYEVEECASCGGSVRADEALEFTIGDREGYACELCVEDGPADFPERVESLIPGEAILGGVVLWPLVFAVLVFAWMGDDSGVDGNNVLIFILMASVGSGLWALLLYELFMRVAATGVMP